MFGAVHLASLNIRQKGRALCERKKLLQRVRVGGRCGAERGLTTGKRSKLSKVGILKQLRRRGAVFVQVNRGLGPFGMQQAHVDGMKLAVKMRVALTTWPRLMPFLKQVIVGLLSRHSVGIPLWPAY